MRICRALVGALVALSLLLLPFGISPNVTAAHADTAVASAMSGMPDCQHQSTKHDSGAAGNFAHCGSMSDCVLTCFSLVGVAEPTFVFDHGIGVAIDDEHPVDIPTARALPAPFRPPRA